MSAEDGSPPGRVRECLAGRSATFQALAILARGAPLM